ncbi:MAG: Vir protein [Tatlockia sp.]|nr:Vir protein [Tatlockia sp.]
MKEILQSPVKPQISATHSSKNSGKCTEQINKIFLKFSIFYGHIWRSQFKNDYYSEFAREEWSQALQKFDKKIIDEAIDECLKNREMPPTLSQFIEFCKELKKRKHCFFKREDYPLGDPKVAQAQLQIMKKILNMKSQ